MAEKYRSDMTEEGLAQMRVSIKKEQGENELAAKLFAMVGAACTDRDLRPILAGFHRARVAYNTSAQQTRVAMKRVVVLLAIGDARAYARMESALHTMMDTVTAHGPILQAMRTARDTMVSQLAAVAMATAASRQTPPPPN